MSVEQLIVCGRVAARSCVVIVEGDLAASLSEVGGRNRRNRFTIDRPCHVLAVVSDGPGMPGEPQCPGRGAATLCSKEARLAGWSRDRWERGSIVRIGKGGGVSAGSRSPIRLRRWIRMGVVGINSI